MKIGEEVVHSSRRSSKSYLCTESGQPQCDYLSALPRGEGDLFRVALGFFASV